MNEKTAKVVSTCGICAMALAALFFPGTVVAQQTVVRPQPIDDLLPNPFMGFSTRADTFYPTTKIPQSTIFVTVTWRDLEPTRGAIDWNVIEGDWAEHVALGRKAGISINCAWPFDSSTVDIPDWLVSMGVPLETYGISGWNGQSPDWDNATFLAEHDRLIAAVGQRYNNDPRVAWISVASYGIWGEWHMWTNSSLKASEATKLRIQSAYINAFSNKELAIAYGDEFGTTNLTRRGGGLYNANLGEEAANNNFYTTMAAYGVDIDEVYKTGMLVGEFGNGTQGAIDGMSLRFDENLAFLKQNHWSFVGPGGGEMVNADGQLLDNAMTVYQSIGYHFRITEATYPSSVSSGGLFQATVKVLNEGVAPFYYPWPTAIAFTSPFGDVRKEFYVTNSAWDCRNWLPGVEQTMTLSTNLPANLGPGKYRLRISIHDPATNLPGVYFGMEGRDEHGRYDLGEFTIPSPTGNGFPVIVSGPQASPATVTLPSSVALSVSASDPNGNPLTYTWTNGSPDSGTVTFTPNGTAGSSNTTAIFSNIGSYTRTFALRVVVSDGELSTVGEVTVTVHPQDGSSYIDVPGKVEAEAYKTGGEGVAYHDTTAGNTGGAYRSDDVDIQTCSDTGGGYNLGWIASGEWLAYNVDIAQAGFYDFTARVAAGAAGSYSMYFEFGGEIVATMDFGGTGGWQTWSNVSARAISLPAGRYELKIVADSSDFNFNYVNVTASTNTPPVITVSPQVVPNPVEFPNSVLVSVTATDPELKPLTYTWTATKVSGTGTASFIPNGSAASYTSTVSFTDEGSYTLRLTVSDGDLTATAKVVVEVQPPWSSGYTEIPGRVEAEEYKEGGEGVGYHDTSTGNYGGAYRQDDVDIDTSSAEGGYAICFVASGEWLAYDAAITRSGTYNISARVASGFTTTKNLHIELDGSNVTGTISFTGTGGWDTWTTATKSNVKIAEGIRQLRIALDSADFNLNYVDFTYVGIDDGDGDGMSDVWETKYLGGATRSSGGTDTDGDQLTDKEEYLAGTDPSNAPSCLTMSGIVTTNAGSNVVIEWDSVLGRSYSLVRRTNLVGGGQETVMKSNISARPPVNGYTVPVGSGSSFYRIKLEQ